MGHRSKAKEEAIAKAKAEDEETRVTIFSYNWEAGKADTIAEAKRKGLIDANGNRTELAKAQMKDSKEKNANQNKDSETGDLVVGTHDADANTPPDIQEEKSGGDTKMSERNEHSVNPQTEDTPDTDTHPATPVVSGESNAPEEPISVDEKANPSTLSIQYLPIDLLDDYVGHPIPLYEDEKLDDMAHNIKNHGVLSPIIVRTKGDRYEILSGHNRAKAAKKAGKTEVPAIIHGKISDEDAWIIVVHTNLRQRSFNDLSHSGKAKLLYGLNDKMRDQGKRSDLSELKMLDISDDDTESSTAAENSDTEKSTSAEKGTRLRTDEKLAKLYKLKRNKVQRYIRIHRLIDQFKSMLDDSKLSLGIADALSPLEVSEQDIVYSLIEDNKYTLNIAKAKALQESSKGKKLNKTSIREILAQENSPAQTSTPMSKVMISKGFFDENFKGKPVDKVQARIEEILKKYIDDNPDAFKDLE